MTDSQGLDASQDRISPNEIVAKKFTLQRRGFKPEEVNRYLALLASYVAEQHKLIDQTVDARLELEAEVQHLRNIPQPRLDIATVTAALGDEAAEILRSATDAAASIRKRATDYAQDITTKVDTEVLDRTSELESELARRLADHEAAIRKLTFDANAHITFEVDRATESARSLVAEARYEASEILSKAKVIRGEVYDEIRNRTSEAKEELLAIEYRKDAVFSLFQQAQGALSELTSILDRGHGVGEATVRAVAQLHAGDVHDDQVSERVEIPIADEGTRGKHVSLQQGSIPNQHDSVDDVAFEPEDNPKDNSEGDNSALSPKALIFDDLDISNVVEGSEVFHNDISADSASARSRDDSSDSSTDPDLQVRSEDSPAGGDSEAPYSDIENEDDEIRDRDPLSDSDVGETFVTSDFDPVLNLDYDDDGRDKANPDVAMNEPREAVQDPDREADAESVGRSAGSVKPKSSRESVAGIFARLLSTEAFENDRSTAPALSEKSDNESAASSDLDTKQVDSPALNSPPSFEGSEARTDTGETEEPVLDNIEDVGESDIEDDASTKGVSPSQLYATTFAPTRTQISRRIKRVLQDDQNGLLDRLRTTKARDTATLIGTFEHLSIRYLEVLGSFVVPINNLTREFYGAYTRAVANNFDVLSVTEHPSDDMHIIARDLSRELAEELIGRVERVLARDASDEDAALASHLGSTFRELKSEYVETLSKDLVSSLVSSWLLSCTDVKKVRWVRTITPGCSDCEDNELEGPIGSGAEFPTGSVAPPGHIGCECLLLPEFP